MAFLIQANPSKENAPNFTVDDRIDALRAALRLRNTGYTRVQIVGDGRLYSLKEFAGTIVIGTKAAI